MSNPFPGGGVSPEVFGVAFEREAVELFKGRIDVQPDMPAAATALALMQRRVERFREAYEYCPFVPTEAIYGDGPTTYVDDLRAIARVESSDLGDTIARWDADERRTFTVQEHRQIRSLMAEYLQERPTALAGAVPESVRAQGAEATAAVERTMRDVLVAHVTGFAALPRALMYRDYEDQRNDTLRAHIPSLADENRCLSGEYVLSGPALDQLAQDMRGVALQSPIGDLLRLPLSQQREIVNCLMDEGVELCRLAWETDPAFSVVAESFLDKPYSPLWAASLEDLRAALAHRPRANAATIVHGLWNSPEDFDDQLIRYDARFEAEERGREQAARPGSSYFYRRRRRGLIEDLAVNKDVRWLEPHEPVLLSEPDRILTRGDLERMLSEHLDLIALDDFFKAEGNGLELPSPDIVVSRPLAPSLTPRHFEGNFANLTLVELPIDNAWLASRFLKGLDAVVPGSIRRLVAGVDLKSSGARGRHIEARAEMLLHAETTAGRPPYTRLVRRALKVDDSADRAVAQLIAASRARAIARYRFSVGHSYQGGSPGSGKHA